MRLGICGGGSWGTALAILWSRKGHPVTLWVRNPEDAKRFREENTNAKYLPGIDFPDHLEISNDLERTIRENQLICLAVPLQAYREFLDMAREFLVSDHQLLLLSKGIELRTHLLPTSIVTGMLDESWSARTYTLSGPSFAREVAERKPTTVVLAGQKSERLKTLQKDLNCQTFRMYRNHDVVGIELCGALKNVIAIASGLSLGLDLGHNTIAGLITRGLVEISRLGIKLGAKRETFAGLAGMGDLILTCTGSLSRNLRVGQALARGESLDAALEKLGMVAEGVHTSRSAYQLGRDLDVEKLGMVAEGVHTSRSAYQLGRDLDVELPITHAVYSILYESLPPMEALNALMTRRLKSETSI